MKRAWYLRLDEAAAPDAAILVGDRSRVRLIQQFMTNVEVINEDRGLLTVVGDYGGTRIIVVAFGMGAPIASVVAHELIDLGVTRILRLGTMIRLGSTMLGDFIVVSSAHTNDGTSPTYRPQQKEFRAGHAIMTSAVAAAEAAGVEPLVGRAMSVDGFYTEMMMLDPEDRFHVTQRHADYEKAGCIGLDMETAALFAIGEAFGVEVGSICVATVDGLTKEKLEDDERTASEALLSRIGLETVGRSS